MTLLVNIYAMKNSLLCLSVWGNAWDLRSSGCSYHLCYPKHTNVNGFKHFHAIADHLKMLITDVGTVDWKGSQQWQTLKKQLQLVDFRSHFIYMKTKQPKLIDLKWGSVFNCEMVCIKVSYNSNTCPKDLTLGKSFITWF